MEENFKKYLIVVRERYEQCDSMKPQTRRKSSVIKKRPCMDKADNGSINWLTF